MQAIRRAARTTNNYAKQFSTSSILRMKYHLSVLSLPNGETCPSLAFHIDGQSYLFNVPEGTQRFCIEHKIRLIKFKNIFFTGLTWDHLGGFPGKAFAQSRTRILMMQNVSKFRNGSYFRDHPRKARL